MQDNDGADEGRPLVSNRTMDILVALLLLAGCGIVIFDSMRLGFNWREGEGPAPGYFPFYVAVILGISSLVNLVGALRGRGAGEIFVAVRPFGRVLAVLIPSLVYVALIGGTPPVEVPSLGPIHIPALGIYTASAIFIMAFMIVIGRENPLKALGVGIAVPIALFLMFEKWFLVPLPKGPLEAWLGY
jgi:putative tricarboxylic transport membrane protein